MRDIENYSLGEFTTWESMRMREKGQAPYEGYVIDIIPDGEEQAAYPATGRGDIYLGTDEEFHEKLNYYKNNPTEKDFKNVRKWAKQLYEKSRPTGSEWLQIRVRGFETNDFKNAGNLSDTAVAMARKLDMPNYARATRELEKQVEYVKTKLRNLKEQGRLRIDAPEPRRW